MNHIDFDKNTGSFVVVGSVNDNGLRNSTILSSAISSSILIFFDGVHDYLKWSKIIDVASSILNVVKFSTDGKYIAAHTKSWPGNEAIFVFKSSDGEI